MKKWLLIATLALLVSANNRVFAQGFEGPGDVIWNIGVSFWKEGKDGYFDYLGSRVSLPAFYTGLEFGIHKYVTVGPYFGFQGRSFSGWGHVDHLYTTNWTVRERWFAFGGRGNFYISSLLTDITRMRLPEQLHLYAGVLLGVNIYHKNRVDDRTDREYPVTVTNGDFSLALAGARWMFTPGFGAFVEYLPFGYFQHLTTGLSFKF